MYTEKLFPATLPTYAPSGSLCCTITLQYLEEEHPEHGAFSVPNQDVKVEYIYGMENDEVFVEVEGLGKMSPVYLVDFYLKLNTLLLRNKAFFTKKYDWKFYQYGVVFLEKVEGQTRGRGIGSHPKDVMNWIKTLK